MTKIIDGKTLSSDIKKEAAFEAAQLKDRGIIPCLAVVLVGSDPASRVYVNNKYKACAEVGIKSLSFEMPENTGEDELLSLIDRLNADSDIHGILVQLPLPGHINEKKVIRSISPKKDVDCFHPENVGALSIGDPLFLPCTPAGIIEMIKRTGIKIEGKDCVVIGRSNIVGKPAAMLLTAANGTVTVCHSKTKDLDEKCRRADIVVSAVGKINTVTKDMIKEGATVIDVGMNRNAGGKLCGDADFNGLLGIAGAITPVPGGVGLMTVAILMKNCIEAAKLEYGL